MEWDGWKGTLSDKYKDIRGSKYVREMEPVAETVKESGGSLMKKLGVMGRELKDLKKEMPSVKGLFGKRWF